MRNQTNAKQNLTIVTPDGKTISNAHAVDSFVECIQSMGVDQVATMTDILVDGLPLVVRQRDYRRQFKEAGNGWLICTHTSTIAKKRILEKIVMRLGMNFSVSLVEG